MDFSISTKNLNISYGDSTIIENLNLNFKKNNFTALVGNNGSGKSTFLRAVSGLHNEYSGEIFLNNKMLPEIEEPFKNGLIAFLSQNQEITFDIEVRELLLMGRFRFKKTFENYSQEDLEAVESIANQLNIIPFLKKKFFELSGGEQQLILIAQVLIQDAEIYLFDEPTQNLDLKNAYFIMNLISELPKRGKTVICSTHDLHLLDNVEGEIVNFSSIEINLNEINIECLKKDTQILRGIL